MKVMSVDIIKVALLAMVIAAPVFMPASACADEVESNRKERNFIRSGNSLYEQERYAEAEVEYKKALEANPNSELAEYNLALSLIRQSNKSDDSKDANSPLNQATQKLSNLATVTSDKNLASKAFYNLGNIAYAQEDYDKSIECYKNCLRRNPDDDAARDNLRLAQKKKQEQEQQQNQQDKQDQKQEEQQQEQKQQEEQQNKDQQQQDQQQEQNNQQNQQQQQQQGGMSQENIDQILKAMQDAEQNTQQRVNEEKAKEEKARIQTDKNW